jgi:hypothetical protein
VKAISAAPAEFRPARFNGNGVRIQAFGVRGRLESAKKLKRPNPQTVYQFADRHSEKVKRSSHPISLLLFFALFSPDCNAFIYTFPLSPKVQIYARPGKLSGKPGKEFVNFMR